MEIPFHTPHCSRSSTQASLVSNVSVRDPKQPEFRRESSRRRFPFRSHRSTLSRAFRKKLSGGTEPCLEKHSGPRWPRNRFQRWFHARWYTLPSGPWLSPAASNRLSSSPRTGATLSRPATEREWPSIPRILFCIFRNEREKWRADRNVERKDKPKASGKRRYTSASMVRSRPGTLKSYQSQLVAGTLETIAPPRRLFPFHCASAIQ